MKTFLVTDGHLRLLAGMYVGWDDTEFGAPAIDAKRPYGNSDVYTDIAEALGIEPDIEDDGWGDQEFSKEQRAFMRRMHESMQTVLQILVSNQSIEVGTYVNDSDYGIRWKKA